MSDIRKRPGVAFWASIALVVVLVVYPLSFGPACWITSRTNGGGWLAFVYRPVICGLSVKDTRLSSAIQWYAQFGADTGWRWAPDGIPLSDDEWISVEWVWMQNPRTTGF